MKRAILNLFEPEEVRVVESGVYKLIVAKSKTLKSLLKLYELLRRERILDSARKIMINSSSGETLTFTLNKQAAFKGRVSFVSTETESPLGPIYVYIEHPNVREVIDWLTPKTKKGKPLWEKPIPKDAGQY